MQWSRSQESGLGWGVWTQISAHPFESLSQDYRTVTVAVTAQIMHRPEPWWRIAQVTVFDAAVSLLQLQSEDRVRFPALPKPGLARLALNGTTGLPLRGRREGLLLQQHPGASESRSRARRCGLEKALGKATSFQNPLSGSPDPSESPRDDVSGAYPS